MAIAIVLTALLLPACRWAGLRGNGDITTENRPVENFVNVDAGGAFDVTWSSGTPTLSITTDQNLLSHIKTEVSGQKLKIDWDKQLAPTKGIKVKLTSNTLTGARFSGAVRFHATNLSGANFFLETAGAARITLEGNVNELTASLSGASKLLANSLHTQNTELSISGAGKAEVWSSDVLKVAISGAGKVSYWGNPKQVEKDISGAGKIQRRD